MIKIISVSILFLIIGMAIMAYAQSTATPIQMGSLSTVGCPGSSFVCWIPYSSTNPIPVSLAITP